MQTQYQEILAGSGEGDMSPGQMLLMGFNGLFTRLEDEFTGLMEAMDSLKVPEVWRKVDAVREGKAMQVLRGLNISTMSTNCPGYLYRKSTHRLY